MPDSRRHGAAGPLPTAVAWSRVLAVAALWLGAASAQVTGGEAVDREPVAEQVLIDDGSWGYNGPHAAYRDGKLFANHVATMAATIVQREHKAGVAELVAAEHGGDAEA